MNTQLCQQGVRERLRTPQPRRVETFGVTRSATWALVLLVSCSAAGVSAQPGPPDGEGSVAIPTRILARTLEHRTTAEAAALVRLQLTESGTLEEQPHRRTIIVRDRADVVARVEALLDELDRPPGEIELQIQLLRASPTGAVSPPSDGRDQIDPELAKQLTGFLRYESFAILAEASIASREGEDVLYGLGSSYEIRFQAESIRTHPHATGKRIRLRDFQVQQKPSPQTEKSGWLAPRELFNASLNLWFDRPFTLVLTNGDNDRSALIVAIWCRERTPTPLPQPVD